MGSRPWNSRNRLGLDGSDSAYLGFYFATALFFALFAQTEIFGALNGSISMTDPIEDRLDAVVVTDGYGVELVIVAAGTIDGESQEGLPNDADQIIHFLFPSDGPLRGIGLRIARLIPRPRNQHARSDDALRGHRFQDIARHLLPHEAVVGKVSVETADDVVAKRPRVIPRTVVFEALAFGVADHVQPMPGPAFSVARRSQKALHQSLIIRA